MNATDRLFNGYQYESESDKNVLGRINFTLICVAMVQLELFRLQLSFLAYSPLRCLLEILCHKSACHFMFWNSNVPIAQDICYARLAGRNYSV